MLEKTLENPRRSNKSILKEISPEYSLEGLLLLKLKLNYSGHLMQAADSLEKTLMLGKIEGRRRQGWQRMRWLDSITNSMDMNLSRLQEMEQSGMLNFTGSQRARHNAVTENSSSTGALRRLKRNMAVEMGERMNKISDKLVFLFY